MLSVLLSDSIAAVTQLETRVATWQKNCVVFTSTIQYYSLNHTSWNYFITCQEQQFAARACGVHLVLKLLCLKIEREDIKNTLWRRLLISEWRYCDWKSSGLILKWPNLPTLKLKKVTLSIIAVQVVESLECIDCLVLFIRLFLLMECFR